jgi:LytS/YehU family sensor histidine kinase
LVENALRHGAAPHIEPTQVRITAAMQGATLVLSVADDGAGTDLATLHGNGSGLQRLRERMRWLYGDAARLELHSAPGQGFSAQLSLPQGYHESSRHG